MSESAAAPIPPEDVAQILYELRVHQIELEMQNEELRQVQAELETSRASYFELFDLAPVGYISVDDAGRISESNLTAAAIFQVPRGALPGRRLSQFISIEQHDELSAFLAHAQADDLVLPKEFRLARTEGDPQWVRLDAAKSKTPHGKSLLRVTLVDISRQVAADETLRRDAELIARNSARIEMQSTLLRKTGALARLGSWRIELESGVREWSDEMYRIFDLELDTPDGDVDIAVNRSIHPGDRERVRQVDMALSADGIQTSLDYRIITADGATRWLHSEGERELDESGKLVAITGFVQDITDRKQVELALLESEQRFEVLFEHAPLGYQSLDEDGRFLEVNLEWLAILGYEYGEVVGRWFGEFLAPEFVEPFRERFPLFKERGKIHSEFEMLRKDGARRTIAFEGRVGHNPDGTFKQTHCILADVTERQRAERALRERTEELERSNMELQRFAYVASHDLREPLRMVTSYTQLLKKRYAGQLDADADDFIGFAVDGAARMEALIDDLLAYSRVGSHGNPFKETDLGPVLDGVLKGLEVAIAENDVTLTHDTMPTVVCDAPQIAQIIQNLIANAIKFRGEDPVRIHLGVERAGEEHVFSLKDNGLGIDPEYFDRIFVIFQRLQSRDDFEGSGMGLAICKRIVQRHHGRIWVESKPGEGSTFYFSLPV